MEDERLTFEARGVLAYILVKPDTWQIQINDLRRAGSTGRDKVYRILNELISFGYVIRTTERRRDGTMGQIIYHVYENPQVVERSTPDELVSNQPLPEKPDTVQPDTVQPYPENTDLSNKEETTNKEGISKKEDLSYLYPNNNLTHDDDDALSVSVKANVDVGSYARGDHAHDATRSENDPEWYAIRQAAEAMVSETLGGSSSWDRWEAYRDSLSKEQLRLACHWCKRLQIVYITSDSINNPVGFVRDGIESGQLPALSPLDRTTIEEFINLHVEFAQSGLAFAD
jgi:hypothetical protein